MAALRLTRVCASVLRPAVEQTLKPCNIARRTVATSATRLKREIQILEPDTDENQTALTTTDKRGKLADLNDPFDLKIVSRGSLGSRDNPDLIPSMFDRRIVGHICEEDQSHITWFYLYKGDPQQCQCGHWFKLVPVDPL